MANGTNNTVDADKPKVGDQVPIISGDEGIEGTLVNSPSPQDSAANPEGTTVQFPVNGKDTSAITTAKNQASTTPTPVQTTPTQVIGEDGVLPEVDPSRVEQAIERGITGTEQRLSDLPIQTADRIVEEGVAKEEQLAQTGEFAQQRDEILLQKDASLAETEQQIEQLAQQRSLTDAEALTRVKDAEIEKANLAVDEQRLTNELAVVEAEAKIETSKQQATWAFNKLGLGFSSGIINEVQRIATNGANVLAKIKVTGAKLLADSKIQVAKLELEYSSNINGMINKYTDISINNKQNSIKRISDTQNNLLLNNKQKEDAINGIKDEFKSEKRNLEDDMKNEQERMSDKLIGQTKTLEQQVSYEQNEERTTINRQFESGSWFTLTSREQGMQLAKAGLGLEEGAAMEKTAFSKTITSEVDTALGGNVTITGDDRSNIQNLSKNYMEGGIVFAEATKRATLDYIKQTPRLKRVMDIQDAKLKGKLSGGGGVKGKPQTKVDSEGGFVSVDPVTGKTFPLLDKSGNQVMAKDTKSLAEQIAEL